MINTASEALALYTKSTEAGNTTNPIYVLIERAATGTVFAPPVRFVKISTWLSEETVEALRDAKFSVEMAPETNLGYVYKITW